MHTLWLPNTLLPMGTRNKNKGVRIISGSPPLFFYSPNGLYHIGKRTVVRNIYVFRKSYMQYLSMERQKRLFRLKLSSHLENPTGFVGLQYMCYTLKT